MDGRMDDREEKANFENLRIYQASLEIVDFVYKITGKFPKKNFMG